MFSFSSGEPSWVWEVVADADLDRAIMQGCLADQMALLASFNLGLLDGIRLQERVQVFLFAPAAVVVVELHGTALEVTNDGV